MKRIPRNIVFLIILFVLFLGLAPRFFILDDVRYYITEKISHSLNSAVVIKKMHWVWLPLPHLTLVNTEITNIHYVLSLPRTRIYPNWRIIVGETSKFGRIFLDRPAIHVKNTAFPPAMAAEPLLPEATLHIKNGTLQVDPPEEFKGVFTSDSLTFSAISGKLKLLPQEIKADIQASSPFSEKINLRGNFNISDRKYLFSLDSTDIKLHKSVKTMFSGRLIPVESTASLTGTVTGQGLQHMEGDLHGTLPCFVVKPEDREIPITCGFADLKLIKTGPLLRLNILDLEVKDPQVRLSGHIERKLSSIGNRTLQPASKPIWTLDITGSNLDLTAIRQKVLILWHDNPVAKIVTNIVLGGRANSAAYRFSGRTADFKNLDAMIIEADVQEADIRVPGAKLDLGNAGGPIQIKNSILTGHGLSAQLGKSFGRNAELYLSLDKPNNDFRLDIDIDAALEDLPPVLARLVKHEGFQRELGRFSGVSGRASAALHLGDSLRNITTRVNVKNMQLAARYEPIPEILFIDNGALNVGPGKVDWLKVQGRIGQQKIRSTSGNVSWHAGDTRLHIDALRARLEGAPLLAMLQQKEIMQQKLSNVLSSLNGPIEITRGSLEGSALQPDSWEYEVAFTATGLTLASPLLPEPLTAHNFAGLINDREAAIQEAEISFLGQALSLKGLLEHQGLENWHGMVEFNGPVHAKLADWLGGMARFPKKLLPQIPCTLENLQLNWQGETFAVSGIILPGVNGGRMPLAKLDLESTPERLRIKELTFYGPGEQGSLQLEFWHMTPHSLSLSWHGFASADTIDALFQQSSFSAGTFSGDFTLRYSAEKPEASKFEGLLQAKNLNLKTNSGATPIIIEQIDFTGAGGQLRIPALRLAVDSEKISGSGQLAAEKDGLHLDISLTATHLTSKALSNVWLALQEAQNLFLNGHPDQEPGLRIAKGWDITGRIGFDFDSFVLERKTSTPYDEAQTATYTFFDVQGDLQLAPDGISRTEIFSSKICGLDFRGAWFSKAELGQKLLLNTNPDETMLFENVLPCLGVQQDIIEGEFSLQASLLKESGTWYGGNIYIKSSQGRILRLKTLSRIFKVVNITDLFDRYVENAGKRGFPYSQMDIDTHIHANNLIVDRAIVRGEGLNLFARGEIHLDDYDTDLTLLIAPFKTFDSIVSKVPLIGPQIEGEYGSRMSIPVAVKGPLADPAIIPMHPEAVGDAVFNLLKDTLMLPYNILKPLEK